jgi:hypothetical protein
MPGDEDQCQFVFVKVVPHVDESAVTAQPHLAPVESPTNNGARAHLIADPKEVGAVSVHQRPLTVIAARLAHIGHLFPDYGDPKGIA